jgi:hypothetical protein
MVDGLVEIEVESGQIFSQGVGFRLFFLCKKVGKLTEISAMETYIKIAKLDKGEKTEPSENDL